MQVPTGLNLNFPLNKRGCFRLPVSLVFTCRRSLPSTPFFSYFAIQYFSLCLSLLYIEHVPSDLTVIVCIMREEHFTAIMEVIMPISALNSCIFILLITIFMLGLLSNRNLNSFKGTPLVQNIQYIHLFLCNLYNIAQELGQRSYY